MLNSVALVTHIYPGLYQYLSLTTQWYPFPQVVVVFSRRSEMLNSVALVTHIYPGLYQYLSLTTQWYPFPQVVVVFSSHSEMLISVALVTHIYPGLYQYLSLTTQWYPFPQVVVVFYKAFRDAELCSTSDPHISRALSISLTHYSMVPLPPSSSCFLASIQRCWTL